MCDKCKKLKKETREKIKNLCDFIIQNEKMTFSLPSKEMKISVPNYNQIFLIKLSKESIKQRNTSIKKFSEFYFKLKNKDHIKFLQIVQFLDFFNTAFSSFCNYDDIILSAMFINLQSENDITEEYNQVFSSYPELLEQSYVQKLNNLQNQMLISLLLFYPQNFFCDFIMILIENYFFYLSLIKKKKKGIPNSTSQTFCNIKHLIYFQCVLFFEKILFDFEEKYKVRESILFLGVFWTVLNELCRHYEDNFHVNVTVLFKLTEDLNIKNVEELLDFSNIIKPKFIEHFYK